MKILRWIKDNVNLVSFVIGVVFVASGREDLGQLIINQGGHL